MSLELMLAGTILISLIFYVLTAGADFGAGVWTLFAGGEQNRRQYLALIDRAIAPIWEANHVWLILVVTILFAAFPKAFALISTTLHIPLTLMLVGIVLRGSAFAFRTHDVEAHRNQDDPAQVFWMHVFAGFERIDTTHVGIDHRDDRRRTLEHETTIVLRSLRPALAEPVSHDRRGLRARFVHVSSRGLPPARNVGCDLAGRFPQTLVGHLAHRHPHRPRRVHRIEAGSAGNL